jgi:transmembrane sensor
MTELQTFLSGISREEDELISASLVRQHVRAHLFERASRMSPARPHLRWVVWAAAAAAAVAILGSSAHRLRSGSAPQLVATDRTGSVVEGSWVSALPGEEHPVRFSDGSTMALSPLSQVRLVELRQTGAAVSLETGRASVFVVHRPITKWEVTAGPFTVDVTGTKFDVGWSPVQDRFELQVTDGQVVVRGCGFGEGRAIRVGERALASCKSGRAEVTTVETPSTAQPEAVSAPKSEELVAVAVPVPVPESSNTCSPVTSSPPVVRSPKKAPTAVALDGPEQDSAAELLRVGNSVRQEGNLEKAKDILLTLRRRFPGSREAGYAAFSLGLIEFDGLGAPARATSWFRSCLAELPSGTLTREARGRLMEALYRSGNAEARKVAKDYLDQYPSGPHAALARRIVDRQ